MPSSLLQRARDLGPEMVSLRRDLHRHPELAFREHRTAARVADALRGFGWQVRTGVGRTGVVAELGTGRGPRVALRADMDALPIQEENDLSYASSVAGVMHACGHDAHTAALVGAAHLLAADHAAGRLPPGRIRLLFQPSEESMDGEGLSGASRMLEEGALEEVDAVVGLHVWGHLPAGMLLFREGPLMAGADEVQVEVRGRSSHAARPHEGVDAVLLAAQGIMAAQAVVSRGLSPMESGVVGLGTIEGGTAGNVVADRVRILGTLRYFDEGVRGRLREGIRRSFEIARTLGGEARVEFRDGYPPVVNDPRITRLVREAAVVVGGVEAVGEAEPLMAAEDFAFLSRAAPGTFFFLGAALPGGREHHHPLFDLDESVLPLGAAVMAAGAIRLLEDGLR